MSWTSGPWNRPRNLRAGFLTTLAVVIAACTLADGRSSFADVSPSTAATTGIAPATATVTATSPTTASPATPGTTDKWQFTLFSPTPASALRGMDTDRPNVTNTPHTVDAGHLQIETGLIDYSFDRSRFSGVTYRSDSFTVAESNFRLGILNNLEMNAVVDPFDIDRAHDDGNGTTATSRGFGDTSFGAKLNLWGNEGGDATWQSALAIQPQFKFPTARDGVGNGHFEFEIEIPFLINLPDGFHLGIQTGASMEQNFNNNGDVAGMQNSISVDRVVIGNLDVYLEYASDVTTQKHVEPTQTIDLGGTYPLGENVVLDTGIALGLNNVSNDIEVLAGFSVRF